jgi:ubiquinol oxidase
MFRQSVIKPRTFRDRVASRTVRNIRRIVDFYYGERLGHRAIALEMIATVPGTIAILFTRLRIRNASERDFMAEMICEINTEKMHQTVFQELFRPSIPDRMASTILKWAFAAFYTVAYGIDPKLGHRLVGYIEEEACLSYSQYHTMIVDGRVQNIEVPPHLLAYWNLPEGSRLKELVLAVREDEARHRDANHSRAEGKT